MRQVATTLPTTIFIREKALVVHLDALRMIICSDQACIKPYDSALGMPTTSSVDATRVPELSKEWNYWTCTWQFSRECSPPMLDGCKSS